MGKQAATKVQAGAEGTGATGKVFPEAPTLRLVSSPSVSGFSRECSRRSATQRLRRGIRAHGARSDRPLPAGLLRQVRRQGRLLPGGTRLRRGQTRSDRRAPPRRRENELARPSCAPASAPLLEALDAEPDVGRALIVEVHAAGPEALKIRAEAMKRITDFIDSARARLDRRPSRRRRSPPRASSPASTRSSTPSWRPASERRLPRAAARVHVLRGAALLRRRGRPAPRCKAARRSRPGRARIGWTA